VRCAILLSGSVDLPFNLGFANCRICTGIVPDGRDGCEREGVDAFHAVRRGLALLGAIAHMCGALVVGEVSGICRKIAVISSISGEAIVCMMWRGSKMWAR